MDGAAKVPASEGALALIQNAYTTAVQSEELGSSTCCALALDAETGVASCANLGDSGLLVGRRSGRHGSSPEIVFRSPEQEHEFGFPFQLGHLDTADSPDSAQHFTFVLEDNDVIVMGSDGLFDNLSDDEILHHVIDFIEPLVSKGKPRGESGVRTIASAASRSLATLAFSRSIDKRHTTPYSHAASEAFGMIFNGGKKDDITVLVGLVAERMR